MRELNTTVYDDDVDVIRRDPARLEHILLVAKTVFWSFSLTINVYKLVRTTVTRATTAADESWRSVRKLGSLLGDSEDVQLRKSHAVEAFKGFWNLRIHPQLRLERLRVRLYMSMCYLFCYTTVAHGLLQTATLAVLKRITPLSPPCSSYSLSPAH